MTHRAHGGSFLLETAASTFTPEDFSPEHRAVAQTTRDFWQREVEPNMAAILRQDFAVLIGTVRKAAELGLVSALVPERYDGMEMDLVSDLIVTEGVALDGSYSMAHGAQSGIGVLPLLLFGTEEQKEKYLPGLASAELIAAYCLSEAQSGSDALNVRTRAELSPEGSHYILNGQKMWITNGALADLYTVFANVVSSGTDDAPPRFTAFLVERNWDGVRHGAEEKKMGLKGSSTTALYFDDVRVPVENVLGEVGRGHIVALNVLNLGRLKIGAYAVGKCRYLLEESVRYAAGREAFGKTIADFGLIQEKLARMAGRLFVTESMTYRLAGMIEAQLGDGGFEALNWDQPETATTLMKAAEEFAAECSLLKVYASEALDFVSDEAVQIYGGYGYHQDYPVERAYRDSRIYRIFEGTNEINRIAAVTMLLRRARKGRLPLSDAVKALDLTPDSNSLINAKKVALLMFGSAYEAYGGEIEAQQEVTARIADVLTDIFAMESTQLRAARIAGSAQGKRADQARDIADLFAAEAHHRIRQAASEVFAACLTRDAAKAQIAGIDQLLATDVVDTITLQRRIADRLRS